MKKGVCKVLPGCHPEQKVQVGEVSKVLGSSTRDDHAHQTMFQARGSIEHWFKKYKPGRLADQAIVGVCVKAGDRLGLMSRPSDARGCSGYGLNCRARWGPRKNQTTRKLN